MEELHFTGNCLKGSRPILSFDAAFESEPHLRVMRELFLHVFGVPQGARKSKPFIDHVMGFSVVDGKIWVRNYQISEVEKTDNDKDGKGNDDEAESKPKSKAAAAAAARDTDINLVEIGPRFVLTPIVIQEGSFGGPIIYENKQFVSPNQVRAEWRRARVGKHDMRVEKAMGHKIRQGELGLRTDGGERMEVDELDHRELFA